jgi:hypothetical protein
MKICILSIGRCGSTSLYTAIVKHLTRHYYCVGEPFNDKINRIFKIDENQFDLISKKENVLIKTILTHKPNGMDSNTFNNWLFTFFDKIILLDRLDKKSQAESFSYLVHTKNKEWHTRQFYNMSLVPNGFIEEWDHRLDNLKKTLGELSIKHNKKIYYYEDIFVDKNMDIINEIFDYLELEIKHDIINEYILSDDRKVRLKEKKNKLI